MSSTVDNINTNLINKINELRIITSVYSSYQLDARDNDLVAMFIDELDELLQSYEFGSIDLLKCYYQPDTTDEEKHRVYTKYIRFIYAENILGKLKRIYTFCRKIQKSYEIDEEIIADTFLQYDYTNIDIKCDERPDNRCTCGGTSTMESKTSETICKCGKTEKVFGAVFEDEQFFFQEGQRTKHGKYDPTKHCKFWLDRIQAKESADLPEKLINSIKLKIKRDNVWLERLACSTIRIYLKELKKTKYNDHVPLIRKIITGIEPTQLTDREVKLVYVYFGRVMQIFNRTKPEDIYNSPYHPFFIYKILEQILKSPDNRVRKYEILLCIHLQSRDTLIADDLIWLPICEQIPEFTYIPTDPNQR